MHIALEAGEPVPVEPKSVADGLNAPFAGGDTLAICRELVDEMVLVSEEQIRAAMRFVYERAKLAASPPEPYRPPLSWPERSTSIRPERPSRSSPEAT